jgi:hypothetical protein
VGVSRKSRLFQAYARGRDGLTYLGLYPSAAEAAAAYDAFARHHRGPDAFLNFPEPGERAVLRQGEMRCVHGHDLVEHGLPRPGRDVPFCAICARASKARYRQRRRMGSRTAAGRPQAGVLALEVAKVP